MFDWRTAAPLYLTGSLELVQGVPLPEDQPDGCRVSLNDTGAAGMNASFQASIFQ